MSLMLPLWHFFAFAMGVSLRVHGAAPPAEAPAVWVANHYNWFDWPMLQLVAPYKLAAVVKARPRASGVRCAGVEPACPRGNNGRPLDSATRRRRARDPAR